METLASPRLASPRLVEWWLAGLTIYVLTFFNLNGQHNYYQIPFLAPLAMMVGFALARMEDRGSALRWVAYAAAGFLAFNGATFAWNNYFKLDPVREIAAGAIQGRTAASDLVITCMATSHPEDPRLLYRADRHGFNIATQYATNDVVDGLKRYGATVLAVVTTVGEPEPSFLTTWSQTVTRVILTSDKGQIGTLFIARLRPAPPIEPG